jgi:hypothetical protein
MYIFKGMLPGESGCDLWVSGKGELEKRKRRHVA